MKKKIGENPTYYTKSNNDKADVNCRSVVIGNVIIFLPYSRYVKNKSTITT